MISLKLQLLKIQKVKTAKNFIFNSKKMKNTYFFVWIAAQSCQPPQLKSSRSSYVFPAVVVEWENFFRCSQTSYQKSNENKQERECHCQPKLNLLFGCQESRLSEIVAKFEFVDRLFFFKFVFRCIFGIQIHFYVFSQCIVFCTFIETCCKWNLLPVYGVGRATNMWLNRMKILLTCDERQQKRYLRTFIDVRFG